MSRLGLINVFIRKVEVGLRKLEFCNIKSVAITVHSSDTIEQFKIRIQEIVSIPLDQQKLIFGGRHLEDKNNMAHYNIQNFSTITLLTAPTKYEVFIKNIQSGKTISFTFNAADTIKNIKGKIKEKMGINPDKQRLIFQGKILEENQTLADYNFENQNILYLVVKCCLTEEPSPGRIGGSCD